MILSVIGITNNHLIGGNMEGDFLTKHDIVAWLFDGFGGVLALVLIGWLLNKVFKKKENTQINMKQKNGRNSTNYQVSGDIHVKNTKNDK